jgi:hypothetical protein
MTDHDVRAEALEWLEAQETRQEGARREGYTLRFPQLGPDARLAFGARAEG